MALLLRCTALLTPITHTHTHTHTHLARAAPSMAGDPRYADKSVAARVLSYIFHVDVESDGDGLLSKKEIELTLDYTHDIFRARAEL